MPPRPLRVLVVDDDAGIRAALADVLEEEGHLVIQAENGSDGLARARRDRPDVILLDLMMPIMDGWSFRELQQADPDLATIPIIVMSASGRDDVHRLGPVEHLHKPFRVEALLALLGRHAER